jgi:hypothetical protein
MKGLVLVAFLGLFTACATMPPSEEAAREAKMAASKQQYCQMAENHAGEIQARVSRMFPGMKVTVRNISCEIVMPGLGRSFYSAEVSLSGKVINQMEVISMAADLGDGWKLVREEPIYAIDHIGEKFHWFIQLPVREKPSIEI